MARNPTTTISPTRVSLLRLLSRLDATLSNSSVALHRDPFARAKVGANLEYARSLLLTLEKEAEQQRGKSDISQLSRDISKQIRDLNERLHQFGVDGEESDTEEDEPQQPQPTSAPEPLPPPYTAPKAPESTLRSRRTQLLGDEKVQAITTSASLANGHAVTLEKQEAEQAQLTGSLVDMAAALKASTRKFGQTLEAEKSTLDRAGEGLQRNKDGLDAAGQKMGLLRKMSEGRGWYGRLLIYGYIAGLWIFAILLLMLPKLRF